MAKKHILKKIKRKDTAVSEVLGTILLLVISVSLFSTIYVTIFSIEVESSTPAVDIIGTIDENMLILEHRGGVSLSLDTEIILDFNGSSRESIKLDNGDYLDDGYKNDGKWDIGERVTYPLSSLNDFMRFDPVDVMVVDKKSSSVVMMGTVTEARVADIKVKMSVSDTEPFIGDDIIISINISNYKGPSDAKNISIKYLLPGYLTYKNSDPSQGNYNNETGIWEVGNITAGSVAIINITVTVSSYAYNPKITQFALLLDGSGSINSSSWNLAIDGLVDAIGTETVFPRDGTVELTIIQFGVGSRGICARLEVGPVVVDNNNYATVKDQIKNLKYKQGKGWTATAAAIYYTADILAGSINFGGFNPNHKQIITLVTDGNANVYSEPGEICGTIWNNKALGQTAAYNARIYLENKLLMTTDKDEFNVIAVDPGPNHDPIDKEWLCDDIVWPQPCYDGEPPPEEDNGWPPPGPGWYNYSKSFTEFQIAIKNHFIIMFSKINNFVEVKEAAYMDSNLNDNMATVSIYPQNP